MTTPSVQSAFKLRIEATSVEKLIQPILILRKMKTSLSLLCHPGSSLRLKFSKTDLLNPLLIQGVFPLIHFL